MSVLKSNQKEGSAYYIEAAEQIYIVCIELTARLNNRYFVILGNPLINSISDLKKCCKLANKIRVDNIQEIPKRREMLHECQGYLDEVISQLSIIETLTQKRGHEMFLSTANTTLSKEKAIDFVDKRINEMAGYISKLHKALNGLLEYLDKQEIKAMQVK